MPDWSQPTLILLPFAAWMFLGVGLPWALALLPRPLWRERLIVLAVSLALGPVGLTTVMFILGTVAQITLAGTLAGSGLVAAVGAALAWKTSIPAPLSMHGEGEDHIPLSKGVIRLETLLLVAIVLVLLANVLITAYWPFVAYDPLWVYAYNAKIFVMQQRIPDDIGYYPQLVPLGYTYMQQAWHALRGGDFNDHAARVIVPWFNLAAVLMAYSLGRLAFGSRRVGLLTAAVWALYPHVLAWSGAGDLEIPLTMYVTGSAAFFIAAWKTVGAGANHRFVGPAQGGSQTRPYSVVNSTRLAILSGLLLAGALWTKPTGGALALGVMLAVAGWIVRGRFRWAVIWPRLRIALIAGLVSVPIGGMWYLRNLVLGHTAIVFPPDYWHDSAQRSGQEFGWPLLIAALVAIGLTPLPAPLPVNGEGEQKGVASPSPRAGRDLERGQMWRIIIPLLALALLLIGILPTALHLDIIAEKTNLWQWARGDLPAGRRLNTQEIGLILAGFGLLTWQGRGAWRALSRAQRETVLVIGALALPYAVVWFFDFSYHYRLSFAIVPLLAALVAALIDGVVWPRLARSRVGQGIGAALVVGATALALAAGLEFTARHWGDLPDDTAKYDVANPALMDLVHALEAYAGEHGPPVVVIPGEDRLPFFFPTWEIRNSRDPANIPTRLEDIADAAIFVDGSVVRFLMQEADKWPNSLIAEAEVGRAYWEVKAFGPDGARWPTTLQPVPLNRNGSLGVFDGSFLFMAYEIHPEARFTPMLPIAPAEGHTIIGEFVEYVGHDVTRLDWHRNSTVFLSLYWRPTEAAPPALDYSVFIHLLDADGNLIAQWDGVPMQRQYPTRFWRPGESLLDYRDLHVPDAIPPGPAQLRIGFYDPLSGERLPVVVDGEPVGDGLTINTRIVVK